MVCSIVKLVIGITNATSPPVTLFRTLPFPFGSRPLSTIPPDSAVANKVWIVLAGGLYFLVI